MKYILNPDIALRSYEKVPFSFVRKGQAVPVPVSLDMFCHLSRCDGETVQDPDGILDGLEKQGVIRRCGDGACSLSPWQKYREFSNPPIPYMTLVITERCNYNCLHCYNASDCSASAKELTFGQIEKILDEAESIGVNAVKLTGGEPMLHPDFFRIVESIGRRGMWIFELVTNGSLISRKTLDRLRDTGTPVSKIRISFDGIGFHDYMRGMSGTEERTLGAVRLCLDSGWKVGINVNFNLVNEKSVLPTLLMLDETGADEIWVIRTTESPRWTKNKGHSSLSWSEYYGKSLDIAAQYMEKARRAPVFFWNYLTVCPGQRAFRAENVNYSKEKFNLGRPVCRAIRSNIVVGPDGLLYPCVSMMGMFRILDIRLADITAEPLRDILKSGQYARLCRSCVRDNVSVNPRCRECPFLAYCGGGCVSAAILTNGRYFGPSDSSCIFFRDRWHEKIADRLGDCTDLAPMDDGTDTSYFDGIELNEYPAYEADCPESFRIPGGAGAL